MIIGDLNYAEIEATGNGTSFNVVIACYYHSADCDRFVIPVLIVIVCYCERVDCDCSLPVIVLCICVCFFLFFFCLCYYSVVVTYYLD